MLRTTNPALPRASRARWWAAATAALAVMLGSAVTAAAATAAPAAKLTRGTAARPAAGHPLTRPAPRPQAAATGTVHYATIAPLCAQPKPGESSCFGLKRVPVAASTPHAIRYVVPDSVQTGPSGGFTPNDLSTAYQVNPSAATTQTVAIVDAYDDPYALAELNAFDHYYGFPAETATSFRKVNQNGARTPLPAANSGWAGEIALDIEAVRGMCRNCKILLVEAASANNANLATAVNSAVRLGARIVSNSYGGPEAGGSSAIQAAYQHPGVVITASTGDNGWYNWDFANDVPDGSTSPDAGASDDMPNTPAAYPSVVAVAGTGLELNPDGSRSQEWVWNDNGPDDQDGMCCGMWFGAQGASGGGCSLRYNAMSFQAAASGYAATGCKGKRMTGDVAALADPATGFDYYSHYGGGWGTIGGTSLASPLVAAMWALAGGSGGVAYPAQNLYDNYRFHPGSTYDVQLGGNGWCAGDDTTSCSTALQNETSPPTGNPNNLQNGSTQHDAENPPQGQGWAGLLDCSYPHDGSEQSGQPNSGECNALTGYDGASGVGTPRGLQAFRSTQPSVAVSHPSVMKLRVSEAFGARITEPVAGATITSRTWTFGDGSAATTSNAHVYNRAGTYTVRLTIRDSYGRTASGTTRITVGHPPTATFHGRTRLHHKRLYRFTSYGSRDIDTGGRIVRVTWNFGDHHRATGSSVKHRYSRSGRYTITETVWDNTGMHTTRRVRVRVVR